MKVIKIKSCGTCMFGIPWKENSFDKEELICLKMPVYQFGRTFQMTYKKVGDRKSIPDWCPLDDLEEIKKEEYVQAYLDAWNVPPDDLDEVSEVSERARELWEVRNSKKAKDENL